MSKLTVVRVSEPVVYRGPHAPPPRALTLSSQKAPSSPSAASKKRSTETDVIARVPLLSSSSASSSSTQPKPKRPKMPPAPMQSPKTRATLTRIAGVPPAPMQSPKTRATLTRIAGVKCRDLISSRAKHAMINDVDETVNHFIPRGNYIPRSSRPEGVPQHYSIAEPDQSLPKLYFNAAQARKKSSRLHDEMQQLAHDWASDKAAFYEEVLSRQEVRRLLGPHAPSSTPAVAVANQPLTKYERRKLEEMEEEKNDEAMIQERVRFMQLVRGRSPRKLPPPKKKKKKKQFMIGRRQTKADTRPKPKPPPPKPPPEPVGRQKWEALGARLEPGSEELWRWDGLPSESESESEKEEEVKKFANSIGKHRKETPSKLKIITEKGLAKLVADGSIYPPGKQPVKTSLSAYKPSYASGSMSARRPAQASSHPLSLSGSSSPAPPVSSRVYHHTGHRMLKKHKQYSPRPRPTLSQTDEEYYDELLQAHKARRLLARAGFNVPAAKLTAAIVSPRSVFPFNQEVKFPPAFSNLPSNPLKNMRRGRDKKKRKSKKSQKNKKWDASPKLGGAANISEEHAAGAELRALASTLAGSV